MATNIKETPNRNPALRGKRDYSKFHYVNVEKPNKDFEVDVAKRMLEGTVSPTDPDRLMYEIEGEDAFTTEDARMTTLRCTREDYEATLKAKDEYTRTMLSQPDPSGADQDDRRGVQARKTITQGDDVILS